MLNYLYISFAMVIFLPIAIYIAFQAYKEFKALQFEANGMGGGMGAMMGGGGAQQQQQ